MPGVASEASRCDTYLDALPEQKNSEKEEPRKRNGRLQRQLSTDGIFSEQVSRNGGQVGGEQMSVYEGQGGVKRKGAGHPKRLSNNSEAGKTLAVLHKDQSSAKSLGKGRHASEEAPPLAKNEGMVYSNIVSRTGCCVKARGFTEVRGSSNEHLNGDTLLSGIEEDVEEFLEPVDILDWETPQNVNLGGEEGSSPSCDTVPESSETNTEHGADELSWDTPPNEGEDLLKGSRIEMAAASLPTIGRGPVSNSVASDPVERLRAPLTPETVVRGSDQGVDDMLPSASSGVRARNRWRRVKHTLAFAHHMSQNVRSASSDFLEHDGEEQTAREVNTSGDAGRAGAAAFEGARLRGRFRAKGRQGMEGMIVRQDKGIISLVQDFYVACLKMPIAHFLVGVFLAPIALGLLFTPIYLVDKGGLAFNGVTLAEESVILGRIAAAKQKFSALVNVFLYALSLSTTFGGSPVAALSPFCLCVANVNTLMGQFLFVFLSGAVFARMSQPSHPIRCSKKAIIRADDFTSLPSDVSNQKLKVFAVRLVLTGPPPCELVDAKICLTFRILIKLPSGSMFCSTQDLDLVRPEVSYLRYGIMVRHVINQKSPIYGHTMESLLDGDASFSLTIMGLERASMQPIFHLEDYFVCDGDVAWDADYIDFIHINNHGHRVLDHSKIDQIKVTEDTKMAGNWKYERNLSSEGTKSQERTDSSNSHASVKGWRASAVGKSKGWNSKSSSFTRADW